MSAHDDRRDVLLRRALEAPRRFAETVIERHGRTGARIRTAGETLVQRAAASSSEHHHHHFSSMTTCTVWRPSLALSATLVVQAAPGRRAALGPWPAAPRVAFDARRAVPDRGMAVSMLTPTPPRSASVAGERGPSFPRSRGLVPPAQLEDVRATPRIRRAETVVARPSSIAEGHAAPTGPVAHAPMTPGPSTTWPTAGAAASVPVPVPPAEVDRITRQVITTIDQRLSAYRERQGRG